MKNLILNKNVKFSTTAVVVLTGVCVLMSVFAIINVVNAGNFEVSVTETGGRMACESMPPFSDTGSNYFTYTISVVNNSSEGYRIAIAAFHSDKAGCGAFDGAIGGGWEIVSGEQNYLPGESGTLVLRYKVDTYNCGRTQYDAGYRPFGADMSESTVFIADVVNYGSDCGYNPPTINNPIGFLDNANCDFAGGWAKDLDAINSIDVDLYLDGSFLTRTVANKIRADIGNYAFHYNYTSADKVKVNDGNIHTLKATAINVGSGSDMELTGSPKTFGPCTIPVSAPTCSITANPSSITQGNYSTLNWSSNNATSCTASDGWGGSKSLSGTQSVAPVGDATYTLTCSGAGGSVICSTAIDVTPVVIPAPTCSITANPSSITQGNYSTLNWSSNNATSCYASNAWYGSKSLSGSQSVSPSNDSTYTLVCSNGYTSTTCSATVDVNTVHNAPTCSIYASPSSITSGNYSTLNWSSNNATSCYASNAWYGSKSLSGSQSVSPSNDSTYTLVCSNGYTSTTCSATVDVNTVHNAPNLRIEKLVRNVTNSNPNFYETVSADLGDELEFLIRVYSIGTGTAYNVRVKDLLPTGLTYVSGTTTIDGSYKVDGIIDGWISVGNIAQGDLKEIKFKAKTSSMIPGVSSGAATINVANQNIQTSTDVSITNLGRNITRNSDWGSSFQAYYGDEAEFSVQVTNNTSHSVKNVTVKETIPSNLSLIAYSTTVDGMNWGGDITDAGLNLGTLDPGQSKTIKFRVIVTEQTSGTGGSVTLTNTAYVSADNISQTYDTASIMIGAGEVLGAVTVATGMNSFGLMLLGLMSCLIAIIVYCRMREHKLSEYLGKENGNEFIKWLISLYFKGKLKIKLTSLRFKQVYF